MRFIANGPYIPDELLLARDEGGVLFFCGAGVSRAKAKLHDFPSLTKVVLDALGSASDSPARRLFNAASDAEELTKIRGLVAYDRIFGLLEREFEVVDVREAVATALRPQNGASLDAHRTLLDLSRNRAGVARVVTTNFDRLFEDCDPDLSSFNPPGLPDPMREHDFRGVVHLHGVVDRDYRRAVDGEFILSSADFGHAYLSDGWATRYIQTLLKRYRLVFVGYSADDPPVQYLLEALSRFGRPEHPLYAFQSGQVDAAAQQWAHKGVTPITYDNAGMHAALWDTLSAWAERARDIDRWYDQAIELGSNGPTQLTPHERGVVAHLAATEIGARSIMTSAVPLPAEWLGVFDRLVRYETPARRTQDDQPRFDPFNGYGIDSDPLPEPLDPGNLFAERRVPDAWDAFVVTPADLKGVKTEFVSNFRQRDHEPPAILPRLAHLAQWITRVSHDPNAVRWAARQRSLPSIIRSRVKHLLLNEPGTFSPSVRTAWHRLLTRWEERNSDPDIEVFSVARKAEAEGWTLPVVQAYVDLFRPSLSVRAPRPWVSLESNADLSIDELQSTNVEYPSPHHKLEIPDSSLSLAVNLFRRQIEDALLLEQEIGRSPPSLFINVVAAQDPQEQDLVQFGIAAHLVNFTSLLKRLGDIDAEAARAEVATWRDGDPVFTRLRIWAAREATITSGDEASQILMSLDADSFWSLSNQRDLLFALKTRWAEWSPAVTNEIEERLLMGPIPFGNDLPDKTELFARYRLDRIHWLGAKGIQLSPRANERLMELHRDAPDWTQEGAFAAVRPMVSSVRGLESDNSTEALDRLPLSQILASALEMGGYRPIEGIIRYPFSGLVKSRPARALRAITASPPNEDGHVWAWRSLLQGEYEASHRLTRTIALRFEGLEAKHVRELVGPACGWIERYMALLNVQGVLPQLFDKLVEAMEEGPIGRATMSKRSWADRALDSDVGRLTRLFFAHPEARAATSGTGVSTWWLAQIKRILNLQGERRYEAVATIAAQTNWLFHVAAPWVREQLTPFWNSSHDGEDVAAFWSGFLAQNAVPQPPLFREMRSSLLRLAHTAFALRHEEARRLSNILLCAWGERLDSNDDVPENHVAATELREVLIHAGEDYADLTLWHLKQLTLMAASTLTGESVCQFLRDVWPRQKTVRSERFSESLVELAVSLPGQFDDIVSEIVPKLTVLSQQSMVLHQANIVDEIVANSPKLLVALMCVILDDDATKWPYHATDIVQRLAASEAAQNEPQFETLLKTASRRQVR